MSPPKAPSGLRCPACGRPIRADDFQCVHCELLLNEDAVEEEVVTEPSVVRALLAPPARRPTHEIPAVAQAAPEQVALGEDLPGPTHPFRAIAGPSLVPRIVAPLEEVSGRLPDLEAYVASFIDGVKPPAELARAARLSEIEVQAVVRALKDRRVVELVPKVAPAPVRARPAPARPPSSDRPAPPEPAAPGAPPARAGGARVLQAPPPDPQEREENVLQRAVALEREGKVDGAIYVLKRGIARVKKPGVLYNRLALILIHQRRDYAEAEALLKKALELEPDNAVFEQNLYKVVGLAAAKNHTGKKKAGGLLARLRGK